MKRKPSLVLLAVLASTLSAGAIQTSFNEDSVTRAWFNVSWGPAPFAPLAFITNGPISDAGAIDNTISVQVDAIHPVFFLPGFSDSFDIVFSGTRLFSSASVVGFAGVQIFALLGDDYGAQVVYGSPLPTSSVPDGGGTAGLTCLACGLLFWMLHIRNRSVQRQLFFPIWRQL
jgi:hypothetical protein